MNKNTFIAFIVGVLLTAFSFHAYLIYQIKNQTILNTNAIISNTNDIKIIVDFINKNAQPNQNAPTPTK